jgi:hypothetical protein
MDKTQLRDMRAILASEANGSAFPKLSRPVLQEFIRRNWLMKVGDTYKSTRDGRAAVLAAGKS